MNRIVPAEISDTVPFSSSPSICNSKKIKNAFADISKNGYWIWVVRDTSIDIYVDNGGWCGGHCFSESLKNPSARITAVKELSSSHISFPCLLIAVEQDRECLMCMFNINTCKVVRAILVPGQVISLDVISSNGGACISTQHLNTELRYFFGIVALGTSGGQIYFLDLCLDENFICGERLPNITYFIRRYEELTPDKRRSCIFKKQHILKQLNDETTRKFSFDFQGKNSSNDFNERIFPTALKYLHNSGILAAGFSFGGVQLWNLNDLSLHYTLPVYIQDQPVVTFAFQEPENDPKNYCYLWVIRGQKGNNMQPGNVTVASLYSMAFYERKFVVSFGVLYLGLQSVNKRFECSLTSDLLSHSFSNPLCRSSLISCQVVSQADVPCYGLDNSINESDSVSENTSLFFLSWKACSGVDDSRCTYHLGVFDLNQWYQAQMPGGPRYDASELNPYFGIFSVEEIAQKFLPEPVMHLHAISKSIKRFKFISPAEEFFYPSSLHFQTLCICSHSLTKATYFGIQKHILFKMAELGPQILVNPRDLFPALLTSGLLSDVHESTERLPLTVQREMILQLALEYHMPFFFMKCFNEFRYVDSNYEYCTSRALLNWAWKKVINIKSSIDKLSLPLFNCSGLDVDKSTLKCLYSYRRQLDLIDTIIVGYQKFAMPRTEQGIQELQCRKEAVTTINIYLQVLLWLRSVCILPEVIEGEETDKNIVYPVTILNDFYSRRRKDLQNIHDSVGPTDILLIDGLVKEAVVGNTWQEKGGSGIYPPPSIYAALSCYLSEAVSLELKKSLMYYLMMDICNSKTNRNKPVLMEIQKFPVIFEMSQSNVALIKAYWYLDQKNFQAAIKHFLDPFVKSSDILPWQHRRIIKSFLFQNEAHKALKYINRMDPPQDTIEDMKLNLSVLLSRGAVTQAFDYQRKKQGESCGAELLNHLFLGCQEMHRLKDLMYLPLNCIESSALVTFLSESEDSRSQEALVIYHLLHCNFFEAAKVNEKLCSNSEGNSVSTNKRAAHRDALIESFLAAVPKTEKCLFEEIKRLPSSFVPKTDLPRPLSFSVEVSHKQATISAYSDVLNTLISDVPSISFLQMQTPIRSRLSSCFENIPFLRPPVLSQYSKSPRGIVSSPFVAKRNLPSSLSSETCSPAKRSRLLDNATFKSSSVVKRKVPKHLAGDVAFLLQSPPIHRRHAKAFAEDAVHSTPIFIPQSILKKPGHVSKLPESDFNDAETPSTISENDENSNDEALQGMQVEVEVEEEEEEEENVSDVEVPGRQIRFSVPADQSSLNVSINSEITTADCFARSSPNSEGNDPFKLEIKEFNLLSSSKQYAFESETSSSMHRKNLLHGLTREPLKSYSKYTSSVHADSSESFVSDKSLRDLKSESTSSSVQALDNVSSSNVQKVSELTVPSSCLEKVYSLQRSEIHKFKTESIKSVEVPEVTNISGKNSSNFESSFEKTLVSTKNCEVSNPAANLALPISGSTIAHGDSLYENSSFWSSSERSILIAPRRPLRANSQQTPVALKQNNETTATSNKTTSEAVITKSVPEVTPALSVVDSSSVDMNIASGDNSINISKNSDSFHSVNSSFDISNSEQTSEYAKRFDFMSENSDLYEAANIPKNAYEMLKEKNKVFEDTGADSASKNATKPSRAFAFTKSEKPSETSISAKCEKPSEKKYEKSSRVFTFSRSKPVEVTPMNTGENPVSENKNCSDEVPLTLDDSKLHFPENSETKADIVSAQLHQTEMSENINKGSERGDFSPEILPLEEKDAISAESEESTNKNVTNPSRTFMFTFSKPSIIPLENNQLLERKDAESEDTTNKNCTDPPRTYTFSFSKPSMIPLEKIDAVSAESEESTNKNLTNPSRPFKFSFSKPLVIPLEKNQIMEKKDDISTKSEDYANKNLTNPSGTFAFSFSKPSMIIPINEEDLECENVICSSEISKSVDDIIHFLEKSEDETYETFAQPLQTDISESNLQEGNSEKTLRSSPTLGSKNVSEMSASKTQSVTESQVPTGAKTKATSKKQSAKKNLSSSKTPREKTQKSSKKSSGKGKTSQKLNFVFSEPHSPAGPEILEALSSPPQNPVPTFMFSPPLTRGRLRQKKLDETFGSSFGSFISEASFTTAKKPPIDPILEEIMLERAPESKSFTKTPSSSKAKSSTKKKPPSKAKNSSQQLNVTDNPVHDSTLADESSSALSTSSMLATPRQSVRHSMVLRQTKAKQKTESFF